MKFSIPTREYDELYSRLCVSK